MSLDARDYFPAVKHGAKWSANDIAGLVGQPYVGEIYYVDANSGSDSAGGKSWEDAFATLSAAEDACTTNNYDVIIVAPNGTSGTSDASAITWDKNHITVIGGAAPVKISQRSRIVFTTDATDPCLTISGQGNRFINLQIATWQASNDVLVKVTGERNYFGNVHFAGIGHATAGDDATARCVVIEDAGENHFEDCTLGVDTVNRSTTNATLELAYSSSQPARNTFRNCRFLAYADNAGALFVKADGANDIDRFVLFEHCMFHNASNSGATTMTVAMDLGANTNGSVILWDSWLNGATDWADDFTKTLTAGSMAQATAATAGLMVAAA